MLSLPPCNTWYYKYKMVQPCAHERVFYVVITMPHPKARPALHRCSELRGASVHVELVDLLVDGPDRRVDGLEVPRVQLAHREQGFRRELARALAPAVLEPRGVRLLRVGVA